jgi:hypothetical protein
MREVKKVEVGHFAPDITLGTATQVSEILLFDYGAARPMLARIVLMAALIIIPRLQQRVSACHN